MLYFIYYASFIIVVPGIILSLICQLMITIRFNKYSKVQSESGWNAHEMSDMLLERQGIRSVEIRRIRGSLTDNYNPSNDVLSLSEKVYDGTDIASLGVAAHECGHAARRGGGTQLRRSGYRSLPYGAHVLREREDQGDARDDSCRLR